jgi:hypothetical protein
MSRILFWATSLDRRHSTYALHSLHRLYSTYSYTINKKFGFELPKWTVSKIKRKFRVFSPKFQIFNFPPKLGIFQPKFRVKNALKWLSTRSFGENYRNFGSTIRDIWLPNLWVPQKFTEFLPKVRKSGNREILRSFGRKIITVYMWLEEFNSVL